MLRHQRARERGTTLLELLLALVLLGVVTAGIYAMVVSSAEAARDTNAFLLTQAQVRAALDQIVDEARWASAVNAARSDCVTLSIPRDTPFSASSPYSVTFAYDAAQDAVVRQESTDANANGCPLSGSSQILAYHVVQPDGSDGLSFEYFDAAGAPWDPEDPTSSIARVRVTVTTTVTSTRNRPVSRTFTGDVALRAR